MELLERYGIEIGPVQLDQTKPKDDLIDIDFKDRDGNWVLRFRDKDSKFYQTRLGKLHNNMTQRAKGNWDKFNTCYIGASASEMFSDPQAFCDWAVRQVGWGLGYHLDKDLLSDSYRKYSEETCVFIPREINCAIALKRSVPAKVADGWKVSWSFRGKRYSSVHQDLNEAERVGVQVKIEIVKGYAEAFKPAIDPRAYAALMCWTPK